MPPSDWDASSTRSASGDSGNDRHHIGAHHDPATIWRAAMNGAVCTIAVLATLGVAACSKRQPQTAPNPAVLAGRPPAPDAGARTGPAEYDIVIRNGRVLDGAGNPWILADVAHQRRQVREDRPRDGARRARDRRARAVRVARLDRHDGPIRRRAASQRARREQAADGRDDGDWRRRRHSGAGRARSASTSPRSRSRASASTSAPTTARRRRASRSWGMSAASLTRRSWSACARSWTRRCAPARWA